MLTLGAIQKKHGAAPLSSEWFENTGSEFVAVRDDSRKDPIGKKSQS